jgi:phosphatidylinositol phospholipase C delta
MADTLDHEWREQLSDRYRVETILNVQPPKDQQVRLSDQILEFIAEKGEVRSDLVSELELARSSDAKQTPEALLPLSIVQPPAVDDSYPLSHYFISLSLTVISNHCTKLTLI